MLYPQTAMCKKEKEEEKENEGVFESEAEIPSPAAVLITWLSQLMIG